MGLLDGTQQDYYDSNIYGDYQFTSLNDIINQFMIAYVGESKIISKIKRTDVAFHAQRALQELSFDTFKSCKTQEFTVPPSLTMPLPHDYVNYVKIKWIDAGGIEHVLYPASKTSNPTNPYQNSDGEFKLQAIGTLNAGISDVTLDTEHKDIQVGMIVTGPFIPDNTIVEGTSNSGGITTINMSNTATQSATKITLSFSNESGDLLLNKATPQVVESLSWNTSDFQITANSPSDIDSIEVGMLVSHKYWDTGTVVTNVNKTNGVIVVSNLPSLGNTAQTGEITFIQPDHTSISDTWSNYKSATPSENKNDDYEDDTYWPSMGERYGLDPQHAQVNGSFYIDCQRGKIHFSSNISSKTVIVEYISDSLGTDEEMKVHKFAEEAMYKWIAHAILSTRSNIPEYIIARFKRERAAEIRKAKIRLSNIKLEEITQVLRGKSKFIKH